MITIYKYVCKDGPNGEERDLPVATVGRNQDGEFKIFTVHNTRGNAYAFRNDRRYRKDKRRENR